MDSNSRPDYVDADKLLERKFFFTLYIYHGEELFYLDLWNEDGRQHITVYGMVGETLRSAVSRELQKSLDIAEWRLYHPILFTDMTKDKAGNDTEHIRVEIEVPYFDIPEGKRFNGLNAAWYYLDG